jgi:hypothetical protein
MDKPPTKKDKPNDDLLPEYDFDYGKAKPNRFASEEENRENLVWSKFSLKMAMRGMEDEEELYTIDDLKESF